MQFSRCQAAVGCRHSTTSRPSAVSKPGAVRIAYVGFPGLRKDKIVEFIKMLGAATKDVTFPVEMHVAGPDRSLVEQRRSRAVFERRIDAFRELSGMQTECEIAQAIERFSKMHGGSITVHSQTGGPTRFVVTL